MIRSDSTRKSVSLIFTADSFADGGSFIIRTLKAAGVSGGFFFTGNFYRNPAFAGLIRQLKRDGHYLGPHSDKHLLYCDWNKRDSLLVDRIQFNSDLNANLNEMHRFGIGKDYPVCFIPPFEWYNQNISDWSAAAGYRIFNYTPGLLTPADYTTPQMPNYRSSEQLWKQLVNREKESPSGLNGYIILVHFGTDPARTDKFYRRLPQLIRFLQNKGYRFERIDALLRDANKF